MVKTKPEQKEEKSQVNLETILARIRAVRQTPKGIQLTDRLLRSLRRK
jgi:primosomal replication protein N